MKNLFEKKKFQENAPKNTSVEKMNNLDRLYSIHKQSPKVLCYKRCCQKFCKCHKKTLLLESAFNKIAGVQAYNFIKRRLQHWCFSYESSGIFKNTYFKEHLKNKEHLTTAAYCLSEAEHAYPINCRMRSNKLYMSTMVLPKRSCFVICLKFSSLFYKRFV